MRKHATVLALLFCLISNGNMRESSPSSLTIVEATQKTQDVETAGDAADDIAIYVHPKKPSQSLIIGTDKHYGLNIYSLSGEKKQGFPDGEINNVDLRYGFRFKGKTITLIGAGNRTTNTMDFYSIDKDSDAVQRLSIKSLDAGLNIYGSCFYQSPISDKFYFFVNSKKGEVIQWEIFEEKQSLSAKKTRSFNVGSQTEGCVSDDDLKRFYVAEENVGIWSYGAEPSEGEKRKLIDKNNKNKLYF